MQKYFYTLGKCLLLCIQYNGTVGIPCSFGLFQLFYSTCSSSQVSLMIKYLIFFAYLLLSVRMLLKKHLKFRRTFLSHCFLCWVSVLKEALKYYTLKKELLQWDSGAHKTNCHSGIFVCCKRFGRNLTPSNQWFFLSLAHFFRQCWQGGHISQHFFWYYQISNKMLYLFHMFY